MATPRKAYLDNLRVILVAGIIVGHAWAGYAELGSWAYDEVREVTIAAGTETALAIVFGPFALFVMGFFFLMAGLLNPGSLSRKGSRRFARDRLLRLGVPLAVLTLVLWPPVSYGLDRWRTTRPARTGRSPLIRCRFPTPGRRGSSRCC